MLTDGSFHQMGQTVILLPLHFKLLTQASNLSIELAVLPQQGLRKQQNKNYKLPGQMTEEARPGSLQTTTPSFGGYYHYSKHQQILGIAGFLT